MQKNLIAGTVRLEYPRVGEMENLARNLTVMTVVFIILFLAFYYSRIYIDPLVSDINLQIELSMAHIILLGIVIGYIVYAVRKLVWEAELSRVEKENVNRFVYGYITIIVLISMHYYLLQEYVQSYTSIYCSLVYQIILLIALVYIGYAFLNAREVGYPIRVWKISMGSLMVVILPGIFRSLYLQQFNLYEETMFLFSMGVMCATVVQIHYFKNLYLRYENSRNMAEQLYSASRFKDALHYVNQGISAYGMTCRYALIYIM